MKKILAKAFFGFLVLVLLLATGIFLILGYSKKKYADNHQTFIGTGRSMEPTFSNGDTLIVDVTKKPKIGDIIVFECDRCNIPKDELKTLTKRVTEINSRGCLWVEGDNKEISYDSRQQAVGWLCSDDIQLYGVVVDVVKNNN